MSKVIPNDLDSIGEIEEIKSPREKVYSMKDLPESERFDTSKLDRLVKSLAKDEENKNIKNVDSFEYNNFEDLEDTEDIEDIIDSDYDELLEPQDSPELPELQKTNISLSSNTLKTKREQKLKETEKQKSKEQKNKLIDLFSNDEFTIINLGNKEVGYSGWKTKHRKLFKEKMTKLSNNSEKEETLKAMFDSLVYPCLDRKITLTPNELQYLLVLIRIKSLGDDLKIERGCKHCFQTFDYDFKLSEVFNPEIPNKNEFKFKNVNFKLKVPDAEKYNRILFTSEFDDLKNLIYHIETINNEEYSIKDLVDVFEDFSTKDIDDLIELFNSTQLTINSTRTIACPICGKEEEYGFDDIPDFIPREWLEKA